MYIGSRSGYIGINGRVIMGVYSGVARYDLDSQHQNQSFPFLTRWDTYSGEDMPSCWGSDGGVVYPDMGVYPDDALADDDEDDGDDDDDDDTDEDKKQAGLLVGPAIGCVGAQVFDSVTTRLRPSHPVDDNRSICILLKSIYQEHKRK